MRYEDASHTGAFQGQGPIANDDTDQIAAGAKSTATGNLITGEGTQTGSAGADVATGGHITAIAGKSGEDSSFSGGKLSVMGEYGKLSVDAEGNYVYQANKGVENVRDRFTYTLADSQGATDSASLIVEIGKTPLVIQANAQQIVVGPDGVVTLPAGVELSDIHVVGRNLVVDMPDGSQLIIIDGAVFVPQLVLGGVEVPATNVAALLVGQEIQPAAGENPPSSGGNFAVPPPPLDPGVPLGDLIPPTEYTYVPPEPQEVFDILDREPEAGAANAVLDDDAQPGGNPLSTLGDDPGGAVANGNLPGSGGDGSLEWALLASGSLPAGLGFSFAGQPNGDVWILQGGVHVITVHVNPANGDYTVTQIAAIDHTAGGNENNEIFVINYSVTDDDGDVAIGTLTINVDDDMPTVTVQAGPDANVILTTDDADTIGAASDTAVTAADFSGVFGGTSVVFGADGPGPGSSSAYALAVTSSVSGLTSHGAAINLYVVGGVVVGSTAATAGAIDAGNTIFTVSTTNAGVVTLTQFQQIDHPLAQDPTPSAAPFADQVISMADGLVTLTRSETAVDGDGDSVTGSATVNIGANLHFTDDGPVATVDEEARLDTVVLDETRPEGTDTPDGDLPNGDASQTVNFADNFLAADFGADGAGSITYQLALSANGIGSGLYALQGSDTSDADGDGYGQGAEITLSQSGNVITGSAGGVNYFTITINPATGEVTFAQLNPIWHPIPGDFDEIASLNTEVASDIRVVQTVTDFDGDTDTASINIGQGVFSIEDDGPDEFEECPDDVITVNDVGSIFTGDLNLPDVGEDEPGKVTFGVVDGDPVLDNGGDPVTSGGEDLFYFINDQGVLEARVGDETGDVIFTITLNGDGTFTYEQFGSLGEGGQIDFEDLTSANAGNVEFRGVGADDPATTVDLLLSAEAGGADATVNTDSDSIGAANQSMDNGETVRIDLVSDLTTGAATPSGFGYSGHVSSNSFVQLIPQVQGNQAETTAFTVWALNTSNTQANEPDRDPTGGFSDSSITSVTEVTVKDYLTGNSTTVDVTGFTVGVFTPVAYGISARVNADGSVTFAGIQQGDSYGINTGAGEFNAVAVQAEPAGTGGSTQDSFDLGIFSIGIANEFEPVDLSIPIILTDADGDSVTCDIDIHIGPPLEANDITVTVNEAGLPLIGSDAASDSETQGGNLQGQVTGGTGPYTFAFAAGEDGDGAFGTLTLNPDGTFSYTLDTPFDSQPDANDGANPELDAESFDVVATDSLGATQTITVHVNIIDDVPSIDVTKGSDSAVSLTTDDADTIAGATDTAATSANFAGVFGLTFEAGADGAATPTLNFALNVSAPGVDSGLNAGGLDIHLYLIGGKVVGSTSATQGGVNAGNTVFDVGVSGTGVVTLTQYSQIDHPIGGDPTPSGAPFADHIVSMADGLVTLTASSTITDNDGDQASDSEVVNIGANLHFTDDGPDVSAVLTGALLKLDETDGVGVPGEVDPVGGNLGTITVSAATLFTVSQPHVSADTPQTLAYSLALSAPGVDSGLDVSSNNASIFLYNIGGVVTGSTSATLGGVNAGNTAFTISINSGTGAVTMTQFLAIEHSNTSSNDEDSSPFNANVLQVQVTATDFDGDTDVASVDLGSVIRFEDDGPSAQNDVDTIIGGNGPATGNLITGIDIGGGDANSTDGVADNVGSDTPGSITAIASVNVPANVDTDPSANFTIAGQYGTLTLNANGDYSYLRTAPDGGVQDVFTYTLTDADGDSVTATLTISIEDKFPLAGNVDVVVDDDDVLGAGGNAAGPDDDAPSNASGNLPGSGGDGALTFGVLLTGAPAGFTYVSGGAGIVLVKQGATTVLTITVNSATGAYSVVENNPIVHPTLNGGPGDDTENNVSFTINYTVTDADGDSAPGTINISVDDDTPTINVTKGSDSGVNLTTDDLDSIGAGTDMASTSANFGGVFGLTQSVGADGGAAATLSFALNVSAPGVDSGLDQGGNSIFLYLIGGKVVGSTSATSGGVNAGNTVFDVGVSGTGVVTLTQYSQIDHPIGGDPTPSGAPFADHIVSMADSLITLTASSTITDNDGDSASDSEVVNIGANLHFTDDGPDVAATLTGTLLKLDETDGVGVPGEVDPVGGNLGTITVNAAVLVNVTQPHVSADTPQTLAYSLSLSAPGVDSGLDVSSNNASIFLYNIGGVVTGSTSATLGGVNAGNTAFTISINSGTGAVTMTQFLAIEHPNTASNDEDSLGIAAGALNLVVTGTDFDGDTDSASVDLGSVIRFEDDGPTLGTIQAGTANNNPAAAHSFGSLHFAAGSDSPGDVTNITTGSLAGITSGGKALVTNFDNASNVLTAYQDFNGNGIYDAGTDTVLVFTLTANPTGGPGGGTWDFDLITALDPTVTEVAIGSSSSFGAGPTLGQTLLDPGGTTALSVVSGYHPTGSFNPTTWFSTGVLNTADVTGAGVNGSTSGWGVDNNNFDNGDEIMFFDFGNQALADPDGAGGYSPPAVSLPDVSFVKFEFLHYSAAAGDAGDDIAYVVHFTDGTFASGFVPDANINGAIWQLNAPAGKFIADVQFFSGREPSGAFQDLPAGKVDLVSVGVTNSTLDKNINFNITLTDADGDPVTGGFTMNIANGNSPSVAMAPVALDLNGDGHVDFLAHDAGVRYDYNGDGAKEATAWVGPHDGILVRDANGNGTVDGASEFVFGHDGLSDLQALAAQYGSTLDANDADFGQFGVWQDANSNGVVDAGEFASLTARGITSINLVSDGNGYSAAGGDVDVVGSSTFTRGDGSTGVLADASFLTGGSGDEQRALNNSSSSIAIAAAVAAAGLAASQPAAAQPDSNDGQGHEDATVAASSSLAAAPASDDGSETSRSALANESKEAANDDASASSSHSSSAEEPSHSLDDSHASAAASSNDAPASNDDQGPATAEPQVAMAATVQMASAEALQAAALDAKQDSSVEEVVAEALGHGNGHGAVDALLNAIHDGNGGGQAVANLASASVNAVSAWDMASNGGSSGNFEMLMKVGAEMLHHDMVQPTHNG